MADFVYNNARVLFATKQLGWVADTIRAALVNANYVPSVTQLTLDLVPSNAFVARDLAITGRGVRNAGAVYGVIDETGALVDPNPVVGVLFYKWGGTDATSPLIYYSSGGVGFPFTCQGLSYQVAYDQTIGGFFQV